MTKTKQVIKTIERAEDFGYRVVSLTLAFATSWGASKPGEASVVWHRSKEQALIACDAHFKRGLGL